MSPVGPSTLILPPSANAEQAFQSSVTVADPAPNTQAVYTVSGNYYETILSVFFALATDATAGNRQGAVQFSDAGHRPLLLLAAASQQPPSNAWNYTFSASVSTISAVASGVQTVQMPLVMLYPGYFLTIGFVGASGPGDQLSNVTLVTQRYPTNGLSYASEVPDPIPTPVTF